MAGRHLATPGDDDADRLVSPGARISDGTNVTVDMEAGTDRPDAAASPARPDELVERGRVGDGHEME
jgi:hypothetical protein